MSDIQDLIKTAEFSLNDAYERGLQEGLKRRAESDAKLEDPYKMLYQFLNYIKPLKKTIVDDSVYYEGAPGKPVIDEEIVRIFKLTHGYF